MKKPWEIVPSDKLDVEIRKKLKRLLQPAVDARVRPDKCYFCSTETTWAINKKSVCPSCCVKYGLANGYVPPDPCEVCGRQGEWCTDGPPVHSLCYIHREEWFHWEKNPELSKINSKKEPEKWRQVWEKGWAEFVACMKEKEES